MTHGSCSTALHRDERIVATKADEFKAASQRKRPRPPRRLDRTPPPGLVVDTSQPGYDLVTGLSSPNVDYLVRDLLDIQRGVAPR